MATRERILASVGRLLAREGFASLGVNAVAREAGVDKVLIYRYFGGIEGLLEAWGRSTALGSFDAAAEGAAGAGDPGDRSAAALTAYARSLRANPEVLEVMRWELVEDNALTRRQAALLEEAGRAILGRLRISAARARALDLPALAAILSAGLLHLALRARTAPEWLGVPLRTEEGWARLDRAARTLVRAALSAGAHETRTDEDEP